MDSITRVRTANLTNDSLRNLLFKKMINDLTKMNCKNFHVEITADDPNKNFYIDKGAKFITETKNTAKSSYTTLDYGWIDIKALEL